MVRAFRIIRRATPLAVIVALAGAAPAFAAGAQSPVVFADFLGVGHLAGSVFGGIGHALLGAFSWTFKLAAKFILITLGALVKLLIPSSWAKEGVQIMRWIVAVPDYAGTVASPGGGHVYGFQGINELRQLFTWIGAGLLPLTLTYATSRAMAGHGEHVAGPILRVVALGALLLSYPYWWAQAAALVNEVTNLVLSLPPVAAGLHKLMLYAVGGVALGGWQLIDLGLMAAIGLMLLSLIFLKVVIILLGALLYATGPVTIGLVPTDSGAVISRAWLSAAGMLLLLPVAWAAVFAVGALLVNDAGTAGPLIAGNTDVGTLLGGVILAVAGLASLWVCVRVAREAGSLMRIQLGGLLALGARRSTPTATASAATGTSAVQSLRSFSNRVSHATRAAGGALEQSGSAGALAVRGSALIAGVGRRGVLGTGAAATRSGIAAAAPAAATLIGRSRAGAVAVQMAKAGTASWQNTARAATTPPSTNHSTPSSTPPPAPHATANDRTPSSKSAQSASPTPTPAAAPPAAAPAPPRPQPAGGGGAGAPSTRPTAPASQTSPSATPPSATPSPSSPPARSATPPQPTPHQPAAPPPARSAPPPTQPARRKG